MTQLKKILFLLTLSITYCIDSCASTDYTPNKEITDTKIKLENNNTQNYKQLVNHIDILTALEIIGKPKPSG